MIKLFTKSVFFILVFTFQYTYSLAQNNINDGYKLIWQDNFDAKKLDRNYWTIVSDGKGGGNKELQYYTKKNVMLGKEPVSNENCLIITAKKEWFWFRKSTSGKIISKDKLSFKYGKLEARIKMPKTANGLWPAFWLLGSDIDENIWPKCGEIDIVEMGHKNGIERNIQDKYFNGACHWGESWNGGAYPNKGMVKISDYGLQDDFHLYTMIWTKDTIKMYLDADKFPNNKPYFLMPINTSNEPNSSGRYFHKPYFILFNLAVGGTFSEMYDINEITALSAGPAMMYVDYIKLYQNEKQGDKLYFTK